MLSQNPITKDGVTYDRLTISLAASNRYLPSGESQTSIALRAVPTAITPEGVQTLDAEAKTIHRGSRAELRSDEEEVCVDVMSRVLVAFLHEQGW